MSPTAQDRKPKRFAEAAPHILDGDQLQFRSKPWLPWHSRNEIAQANRSEHSHSAKAVWFRDTLGQPRVLMCAETREGHGARLLSLENQVARQPGLIDVYRSNPASRWPEYDRQEVALFMVKATGWDYGWRAFRRACLHHIPFVRWAAPPLIDDSMPCKDRPFCSGLTSAADRIAGGVDPVKERADDGTEPGDLSASLFYEYLFTLVP